MWTRTEPLPTDTRFELHVYAARYELRFYGRPIGRPYATLADARKELHVYAACIDRRGCPNPEGVAP
jgi:hypothetical protein